MFPGTIVLTEKSELCMRWIKFLLPVLLFSLSAMGSDIYFKDRMLFCLKRDVPKLQIAKNSKQGVDILNNARLNKLVAKYKAVSIRPWLTSADENDVIDGVDLSRIYEVVFKTPYNNEELSAVRQAFNREQDVHSTELVSIKKVAGNFQPYVPNDPYFDRQWYIQTIGADKAWKLWGDRTPGDSTVLVGVVDTGFDYLHPDLQNVLYLNPGEDVNHDGKITAVDSNGVDDDGNGYVDDWYGWDFVGSNQNAGAMPDNDVRPPNAGNGQVLSHGTHVGGVIVAATDNNVGIAGISFRSKLIFTKQSYDNDYNHAYLYHSYDGIMYCAKMGAKVINCSWGGEGGSLYEKLVINKVTNDYGAIVVCAAGNDNNDNDEKHFYPSDFDNSIAVAAVTRGDKKAYFSNYGEVIDLSAPGTDIFSTIHANAGSYASWQGTSMASPIAAASFVLLKAYFPDSSRQWLVNNILNSADNIDDLNPGYAGQLGSGRVNVFNAIAHYIFPSLSVTGLRFMHPGDSVEVNPLPGDTLRLRISVKNAALWRTARDVRITVRSSSPFVSFPDSIIEFDEIDQGTELSPDDEAVMVISDQANYEPFELYFSLSANQNGENPYEAEAETTVDISLNQTGFPTSGSGVETPLAISDLNGDGQQEIIGVDDQSMCFAYGANGEMLSGFPVNVEGYTTMAPVVTDVNNDGRDEVVLLNRAGTFFVISADGKILTKTNLDEPIYGNAAAANLDDDDEPEIVFGSMRKKLYVLNADGTEMSPFPLEVSSAVKYGVAVADLDGDGLAEIVFITSDKKINAIHADGSNVDGFPLDLPDRGIQPPVVFRENGQYRILVAADNDTILKIDGSGNVAGYVAPGSKVNSPLGLADMDGDQIPEIVFATEDGAIQVFTSSGNSYPGFPVQTDQAFEAAPVFADLDGDGVSEIILNSIAGELFILKENGQIIENFPAVFNVSMRNTGAVADLDGDGDLEVVLGSSAGVYAVDIGYQAGSRSEWSTFLGNNNRTGDYQQSVTGIAGQEPAITRQFELYQNYPNPFGTRSSYADNPVTTIKYRLAAPARVELAIYDIRGRLIKNVARSGKASGTHSVHWDGTDRFGAKVASGIYFYRLKIKTTDGSEKQMQRKMLLLK
ncbi:MAG TPA: T9SS type A sorting domain-containing protein [Caldithrix abyssi]|uniref:T9SS type A sorting domain-containing protein n=1 Tax=Caldithrix abyssi TaxID=187145 RepID=A0A7V5PQ48_CALAY|nr:T9SS type A sorting domain-containing protein [Caldithrix abyssi]